MAEKCGCKIKNISSLGQIWEERIIYCPLHAAAGAMQSALKIALSELYHLGAEEFDDNLSEWRQSVACKAIRVALNLADKKAD